MAVDEGEEFSACSMQHAAAQPLPAIWPLLREFLPRRAERAGLALRNAVCAQPRLDSQSLQLSGLGSSVELNRGPEPA